jgi:AbrB family transcriptional regulator, transcriptional pleiotropic regulator of transition state genes
MRAIGVVRKLDHLGRVVIPKEVRDIFDWNNNDPIEMFVTNDQQVVLQKYYAGCYLCGNVNDEFRLVKGKKICSHCIDEISSKEAAVAKE